MTTKGDSHEPERPSALPAQAATFDLGTLVDQLVKLGLDFAAEALPAILTRAVKEDLGAPALLEQLLKDELGRREERRIRTSLRLSGPPTGQTLANFDFAFQPAVQRSKLDAQFLSLGDEFRIAHHGVEGATERCDAVCRHVGCRQKEFAYFRCARHGA